MVDLQTIADELARESNAIRASIEQLQTRDAHVNRALDELRLIGVDTPDQPKPIAPPAEPDPLPPAAKAKAPRQVGAQRAKKSTPAKPKGSTREIAKASARGSINYVDVAAIANKAIDAGQPMRPAIRAHFGVSDSTANNWLTRCRQLALLSQPKPFTREPITRMPVDPQKIRDEQAGPPGGKVQGLTGSSKASAPKPKPAPAEPAWTPERAREHLQAVPG